MREKQLLLEIISPCVLFPSKGEASDGASKKDATWPRALPPRRKKEKDVFKFLKEDNSSNYTVRRQEFQISRVLEKSRVVREVSLIFALHSPAIVKQFAMLGQPVLHLIFVLKVRRV